MNKEELQEEVRDCELVLKHDEEALSQAKENVYKSKVALAEAIITLNNYEKTN